jgi:hypothetical protein
MHESLSTHAVWTSRESLTSIVRLPACCPCEVMSTWSSWTFCFSVGPLEQDSSWELMDGWILALHTPLALW